jgi:hypothetical protein
MKLAKVFNSRSLKVLYQALLFSLLLAGCTEEKAIALKTAAEAFGSKSVGAIDALYELHIRAAIGPQSDTANIQDSLRQIQAVAATRGTVSTEEVNGALAWMSDRSVAETKLKKLQEAKQAYIEYSNAFARLPEGSVVAANAVACSTALGARLVYRLTEFHAILAEAPIDYFSERTTSEVAIDNAAKNRKPEEIEKATLAYIELRKTIQRDNQEALNQLAQAAEAGQEVLDLTRNYNRLEVKDFLAGVTRILELRANYLGTTDSSLERVRNIRQKLESDSQLGPILNLPTISMIPECKH